MTSSRPYLLRAIYDWLVDNSLTPYLLVDATLENVTVPLEHVQDGKIILNISPNAVQALALENDYVSFNARFSGKAMDIYIPMAAAMALYAQENGKGMMFPEEEYYAQEAQENHLQSVDSDVQEDDTKQENISEEQSESSSENTNKEKKKAPFLTVVK